MPATADVSTLMTAGGKPVAPGTPNTKKNKAGKRIYEDAAGFTVSTDVYNQLLAAFPPGAGATAADGTPLTPVGTSAALITTPTTPDDAAAAAAVAPSPHGRKGASGSSSSKSTMIWVAVLGAAAVGAYFMFGRKGSGKGSSKSKKKRSSRR
jgi:hypothetical protein